MKGRVGTPMHLVQVQTYRCNHRWSQWKGSSFGDLMTRECPRCGSTQERHFAATPPRTFEAGDGSCTGRHHWSGWTPQPHGGQHRQCWNCGATQTEGLTEHNQEV